MITNHFYPVVNYGLNELDLYSDHSLYFKVMIRSLGRYTHQAITDLLIQSMEKDVREAFLPDLPVGACIGWFTQAPLQIEGMVVVELGRYRVASVWHGIRQLSTFDQEITHAGVEFFAFDRGVSDPAQTFWQPPIMLR